MPQSFHTKKSYLINEQKRQDKTNATGVDYSRAYRPLIIKVRDEERLCGFVAADGECGDWGFGGGCGGTVV